MRGGPAADFLRGGQGDDVITGNAGNDQLVGDDPGVSGGGNDSLDGGDGNDAIDGQDGDDIVRGGTGDDTLQGGAGNDSFPAEAGSDGSDQLFGGDGIDSASYAARTAPLTLSLDDVTNDGQDGGGDNVHSDIENLVGGSASDVISGSDAANVLDGGPGDDSISAGKGDDKLIGGPGNDTESGGDGADALEGGDANDTLSGDAGSDALDGGAGSDTLAGGADADALNGGAGDDSLDGGTGADSLSGGDGTDVADYSARSAGVAVTLDGQPGDGEFGENDNVGTDVENVSGGSGADTFIGSAAANMLDGGGGEDYEDGGAGADTLIGGDSGDVLRTRGGDGDRVVCGPGPDFVIAKPTDIVSADCDRVDRGVNQQPKLRDSAVVAPSGGTLQMSPTGIVRRVPLQDKVVLPLRSIVDTTAGAVKLTSALTTRKSQAIRLDHGAFNITQTAARLAVTQLALQGGDFLAGCPATARGARIASAAATRTIRKLWASGKGKFRTKGRYASASIRGTKWLTEDRCDGTRIRVASGQVTVRDLVRRTTVVVKAGRSYFASATRARRKP